VTTTPPQPQMFWNCHFGQAVQLKLNPFVLSILRSLPPLLARSERNACEVARSAAYRSNFSRLLSQVTVVSLCFSAKNARS